MLSVLDLSGQERGYLSVRVRFSSCLLSATTSVLSPKYSANRLVVLYALLLPLLSLATNPTSSSSLRCCYTVELGLRTSSEEVMGWKKAMNERVLSAARERRGLVANFRAVWVYWAFSCMANFGPEYSATSTACMLPLTDFAISRAMLTAFLSEAVPATFAISSTLSGLPEA